MSEVQNTTFDDVPESVELENGTYLVEFTKTEFKTNHDDKDYNEVTMRAISSVESPMDDVTLPNAYPFKDRFWLHTPPANRRAKNFFENVMSMDTSGVSKAELFEALLGQQVVVTISRSEPNNEGRVYVNVDNYKAA